MTAIQDTSFVVVDTETTGIRADSGRVIEVAAVRVEGGEVTGRFSELIDPGRSIPRRITEITGITTAMVFGKPRAEEVLPRLLDFMGDGVLVAHNLGFDQAFLDAELRRCELGPLPHATLCTLRLARRLLRGLHSKSLSSVADFYGIRITGRHRAAGDAEATAAVLLRFLAQLEVEHGIETVEELLAFQRRTYRDIQQAPRHLRRIREEVLPGLPTGPGVYFMRDSRGGIIYIGKAQNLQVRVRSYFSAIEAHEPRLRQLVRAVREITWQETRSELAALLLESRLIKEHQPRYNRAQLEYRSRPFIRLEIQHGFPRVSWVSYLLNDGAEYFGPLAGRSDAALVVELIDRFFGLRECDDETFSRGRRCLFADLGRCLAPCESGGAVAAYQEEVERVRGLLTGSDRSILDVIERAMKEAAGRLEFEVAATYRDWLRRLEQILDRQRRTSGPVLRHNAVVVLREPDRAEAELFLVRFGRPVESLSMMLPPPETSRKTLFSALERHFDGVQAEPERYFKKEVDEIRILSHWMHANRDRMLQIEWEAGSDAAAFADLVFRRLSPGGDGA